MGIILYSWAMIKFKQYCVNLEEFRNFNLRFILNTFKFDCLVGYCNYLQRSLFLFLKFKLNFFFFFFTIFYSVLLFTILLNSIISVLNFL